jgi:hypothetical protein
MSQIKEDNNNAFCCTSHCSTLPEIFYQCVQISCGFNPAFYPASKGNTILQGNRCLNAAAQFLLLIVPNVPSSCGT